ncbi:hypothetical protein [Candidatus Enterococcus ikei]|uniref:DUF3139 domain-containing protein n=1 Tax=Candidatus Enterococcus ikei TaxID=2815326 RepID=A0ABS3H0V1_9ENTE|nr:hypothetical protein [Enterococcus sp. DIV0869a]MBO0440675.1 hypothetical protein [Enterococcus sp. DIV0869a]
MNIKKFGLFSLMLILIVTSVIVYQTYRKGIAQKSFNNELEMLDVKQDDLVQVRGMKNIKFSAYQYFFEVKHSPYEYIFTYYYNTKETELSYITDKSEIVNTRKIIFGE